MTSPNREFSGEAFDAFALCSQTQTDPFIAAAEKLAREQAAADLAARQLPLNFSLVETQIPDGPFYYGRTLAPVEDMSAHELLGGSFTDFDLDSLPNITELAAAVREQRIQRAP